MATLIIEEKIETLIEKMESQLTEVRGLEREELEYKLKLARSYRDRKELDFKFDEIQKEKFINPIGYISRAKELVKKIPGISYNQRDDRFCVRVSRRGNRVYLGMFKKVSEAVEILDHYLKTIEVVH